MSRYIEVRFTCPRLEQEQVQIIEGFDLTIEQIRAEKQIALDAGCKERHTILSVGEVDSAHATLTNKKQIDAREAAYYDGLLVAYDDDDEEDEDPEYMYYEDDDQSTYWDDLYADEDNDENNQE